MVTLRDLSRLIGRPTRTPAEAIRATGLAEVIVLPNNPNVALQGSVLIPPLVRAVDVMPVGHALLDRAHEDGARRATHIL
mgnify:CR=1 FL=1